MSILIVLAKAPVAGRVKTRLCPPLTAQQAADVALVALNDTLAAVAAVEVDHRVLVLDGEPGDWVPDGFLVMPQKTGLLDQRLIDAFADVFNHVNDLRLSNGLELSNGPGLTNLANKTDRNDSVIEIDGIESIERNSERLSLNRTDLCLNRTEPCVLIAMDTPQVHPRQLSDALAHLADADAVIGMAEDGGFWLIGLNAPNPEVFRDIPMSLGSTGAAQLERLHSLDLGVVTLDTLRDIDTLADIDAVTEVFPDLAVSHMWAKMKARLANNK
jgi:uncharacterized protein